ncbi:hypothetical protein SH611_04115 [Geminicoccaceae bacterium 1502E]|nr:hypothetical protein [Geminicoccaceae bacterium 1502E]
MMTSLAVALHALAALLWVGGMAFAYMFLRPSLPPLAAAERLGLWRRLFGRFFPAVGGAILVLLVTGYWLFLGAGISGGHVHLMQALGWLMFLLYGHLVGAPWKRFRNAVDDGDVQAAAAHLESIRRTIAINLVLGVVVVAVGASGRYW